ncbi:MAG: response regulator [Armatimonas sp.]
MWWSSQLRRCGCEVEIATDGAHALEKLEDGNTYDLILMDCQMPVMDGFEATRQIRQREADGAKRTPIVAMTAYALPEDRERCLAAGMDSHLVKPVRQEAISQVLAEYAPKDSMEPFVLDPSMDPTARQLIKALFRTESEALCARLKTAQQQQDSVELQHAAHALKGMLMHLNLDIQAAHARELEELVSRGDWVTISTKLICLERDLKDLSMQLEDIE